MFPPADPQTAATAVPADPAGARDRLLAAALQLFSERGFARASTRAVADAAGTNIAAIRYYFGDKAGLYRAVFAQSAASAPRHLVAAFADAALSLRGALHCYYAGHLALLKQGAVARQTMRLHVREMLEPTDQWAHEIEHDMLAPHAALLGVLRRHLGLAHDDDDLHRLAFNIAGPAVYLFVAQDTVHAVRPSLLTTADAIDRWCDRMADQALAAVEAERTRRGPTSPSSNG